MSDNEDSSSVSASQSNQLSKKSPSKNKKTHTKAKGRIIINVSDCQYPVVPKVSKSLGWKVQRNSQAIDWDVWWTDNAVQPEVLLKMELHQKINHFPGMYHLSRKNMMGRYLMKMRKKFPEQYTFFPLTWMLPIEYHQLRAYFQTKQKGKARTFIIKPEAMSQGKGIYLTRKLEDIEPSSHCVVQRYLHKPYLIQGLKFDLRIYVLVAGVDPLRLYIYEEGLTRFATEKYQPPTRQNMEDTCMHLTNYAINKDNPKFVFNNSTKDMTKGHKRSLKWFYDYMSENQPNRSQQMREKIEQLIVKTMISGLPPISNQYRSCQPENYASNMCFQLLGFDVLLTQKCEPILLQINHTPSFSTDTPLDNQIKTNFIKDSLALMNINTKTKNQIIKARKQLCQQRVITGKKIKYTVQERQIMKQKAQNQRNKYEDKNIGGFKRIHPVQQQQKQRKYDQFLKYSEENYLHSTGMKNNKINSAKKQKTQSAFGTCISKKHKDSSMVALNKNSPKQLLSRRHVPKKSQINEEKSFIAVPKSPTFSDKNINFQRKQQESSASNDNMADGFIICEVNSNNNSNSQIKYKLSGNQNQSSQQSPNNSMSKIAKSENNLFKKIDQKVIELKKQCSQGPRASNYQTDFIKQSSIQHQDSQEEQKSESLIRKHRYQHKIQKKQQLSLQIKHRKQNFTPHSDSQNLYNKTIQNKIKEQLNCGSQKQATTSNYVYSRQKKYKNPTNIGIYFQPNSCNHEQNNLSRNIGSSSGQRNNQSQKRGLSVGFMTNNNNSNKVNITSNIITSVRKTNSKNNQFTTVTQIPLNQNSRIKQTNIPEKNIGKLNNKIPITLNTLLINGYDSKGNTAVSANNLRKILSVGNSGQYNAHSLYAKYNNK